LLASINGLDARIPVTSDRVTEWAEMLTEKARGLTLADARQISRDHYAESSNVLTLDILIAAHRKQRKVKESLSRSETASQPARVPMPEWFKAAVYDMQRPQAGNDGEPMSIGQIFASASHFAKTETAADPLDRHCFGSSCSCSHESCYRGWLDSETETSPCRQCKPGLALVLDEIAPLGSRNPHDQQLLESIEHRRELLGWSGIR
jgi:hypothetical protein